MLEKNEESSPAVRHRHTYSCFVPFGVLLLSHHWFAFYPSGLSNTNRVILGAQLYSLFLRSVSHVTVGQSDVVIFDQHKQWGELKPNKNNHLQGSLLIFDIFLLLHYSSSA